MEQKITPPKRLHKVLLQNDGQVLILQRSDLNAYFPHFWGIPTALADEGEGTPTFEEIEGVISAQYKIPLHIEKNAGEFTITLPDGHSETIVIYEATTTETSLKLDPKHTQYKWVTLAELAHYNVLPSLEQYLRRKTAH